MCLAGELDMKRNAAKSGITFDDFLVFWKAIVDANLTSRVGKFWFLIKPRHRSYIIPEGACVFCGVVQRVHGEVVCGQCGVDNSFSIRV